MLWVSILESKVIFDLFSMKKIVNLYLVDEYVAQQLNTLNQASHHNAIHLSHVQENVQSAVDHISRFLTDQVDFEAIHREAMLKVHRDELLEQQSQQPVA